MKMPGLYDDVLNAGPFEKFVEIIRKNGKIFRKKRLMTRAEIEAANQELLDQIAVYAKKLEYCINKYNVPLADLEAIK
jgi:hypothetical protein